MDISKESIDRVLADEERKATVTIYQRDGEPYLALDGSKSTFTVVGSESKSVRAARAALQKRLLNSRRIKLTPADIRRNRIDTAAAGVTDWHGWDDNGKDVPFSAERVSDVLRLEHILEQAETAIAEHADFFAKPSET